MEVKFVIINDSYRHKSCQDDVFGSPVRSFHSDCLKLMNYEISSHRLQKKNIEPGIMNQYQSEVGGQHCQCHVLVSFCPDFPENRVRCLSAVRILSGSFLSRFSPLSGFSKRSCPLSVCPGVKGRDKAVRTFTVLVRRRQLVGSTLII